MKNIILQHWSGPFNKLCPLSMDNVQRYAKSIDVPYQFINGNAFDPKLEPPCQKLIMLHQNYDEYDNVAMLDMDMFVTNSYKGNIFEDIKGIGLHDHITDKVFKWCRDKHPNLTDKNYPYWGGCLWMLPRIIRIKFRKHLENEKEYLKMREFSGTFNDEGIMHRLAILSDHKEKMYFGSEWSQGSYFPNPEKAKIIHIRPRDAFDGPKIKKINAYMKLKARNIIE